ncbi:7-deoxyloganetic acid glucosyltransferase [Heracleum sosnowskyi]|uniref:7-deoxyloganetic acid glucosyltransferase n=1 Tax=Heracleum sosnowskyi TaxID=360622 RepID=A0AAD8MN52_9APIA|nr:7-deoxyloganetic acid glucosyltransferase [Heracleum sosnowskyi]
MTVQNTTPAVSHVLIFPLPLQGAVNSMLKLAQLLSFSDINITFLVTDHIYSRLLRHSNVVSRFKNYSGFVLHSISDGLPEEHPRSGARYMEMFDSMKFNSKSLLKELLTSGQLEHGGRGPVTCIIADGVMSFVCDVANEIGISIFYTRTLSPCSLSIFFSLPKLIQAGELPFTGGDLDNPIKSVPGMENFLRGRDLPSFCRSDTLSNPSIQLFKNENQENARAQGLILNSFDDLEEGPVLDNIRASCPNIYTIGPLHTHLKMKLSGTSVNSRFVSEVWKLGLDMKDTCDRVIVEKMVTELMIERKDEFIKSADRMAMLAKKSLSEGGTSCSNLERLVKDIKSTTGVVHKEATINNR